MDIIPKYWENKEGTVYKIRQRNDGYFSATDMCKTSGKLFGHWHENDSTLEYLEELSGSIGIPIYTDVEISPTILGLVDKITTGPNNERGTWIHRLVAIRLAQWLLPAFAVQVDKWVEEILNGDRTTKKELPPVTDETIKIHIHGIKYLTDGGDIQLAQILKARFGNLLLAEQQNSYQSPDVEQLEGAVDVAIRLGFQVPKNYESSLGNRVAKECGHLLRGKNTRYSYTSSKNVPANMYPANHPEVEHAVTCYCVEKAFKHHSVK